jgi:hypothetical protein
MPGEETADTSIVYVNAVQNGFALKKSDTSASVGLSVLGSLSLPIRSNNDAMVKISSETIPSGTFYDRFFALLNHYLQTVVRTMPVKSNDVTSTPLPAPAAVPVVAPVPLVPAPKLATTPVVAPPSSALNVPVLTPVAPAALELPDALGRPDMTQAASAPSVSP